MQKPSTVFMFVPWKTVYCFSVYCWLKPIFPDLQITAILVTNTAQHQKLVFSLISNTTTTIFSDEPSLPLLTSSLSPARRIANNVAITHHTMTSRCFVYQFNSAWLFLPSLVDILQLANLFFHYIFLLNMDIFTVLQNTWVSHFIGLYKLCLSWWPGFHLIKNLTCYKIYFSFPLSWIS